MSDNFRRMAAERAIGGKTRLRDFEGVGDQTLRDLRSSGFRELGDIQDASVNELAEVDGIGQKRAQQIKNQAPRDTSRRRSTGSVSAAGIRSPVGDFKVGLGDKDSVDARHTTRARGDNAVRTDNRRRAPITTDKQKWVDNPGRYDYPGVDTPTDEPTLRRRDIERGDIDRDDLTGRGQRFYDELQSIEPGGRDRREQAKRDALFEFEPMSREDEIAAQARAADISLSPEEAREEQPEGAVGTTALGGFDPFRGGERAAPDEPRISGSRNLPKSLVESFASGPEADMAFIESEEERASERTAERQTETFDFPEWTISRGQTYLNEKVFGEGREDLEPLRERVKSTSPSDPLELNRQEYNQFQRVVREGAENELEQTEGMSQNLFGDVDQQREIAEEAKQGIFNNPPTFGSDRR